MARMGLFRSRASVRNPGDGPEGDMLEFVISGGQTGVDQAAWRAAKSCGLPTGGMMPKGFLTECGPRPEFAGLYGAQEGEVAEYSARTRSNVEDADGTLILLPMSGPPGEGTRLAARLCEERGQPYLIARTQPEDLEAAVEWLRSGDLKSLNVAGPRESICPGIGAAAEAWLSEVFRRTKGA
jgi:hypothetical protein